MKVVLLRMLTVVDAAQTASSAIVLDVDPVLLPQLTATSQEEAAVVVVERTSTANVMIRVADRLERHSISIATFQVKMPRLH